MAVSSILNDASFKEQSSAGLKELIITPCTFRGITRNVLDLFVEEAKETPRTVFI